MADIELLIKIPEKTINEIKDNVMFVGGIPSDIRWDVTSAIVNGTPLPKGHGDLIDRNEVCKLEEELCVTECGCCGLDGCFYDRAKTIIEADTGK